MNLQDFLKFNIYLFKELEQEKWWVKMSRLLYLEKQYFIMARSN